eukprot:CAMPEP_0118974804 /NCGR_PEP_ID=MMETSP1173-20130426/13365_1 /TAXON_ID=1034831 /ORGANISM="Rhizochromulina marina cf, Strain CCMP1243" /LENGTH=50 /DNA_ID=CAMNT_0006924597 /DNA_START=60 /DNA_END=209 /DNA_ORIENTATION=-
MATVTMNPMMMMIMTIGWPVIIGVIPHSTTARVTIDDEYDDDYDNWLVSD